MKAIKIPVWMLPLYEAKLSGVEIPAPVLVRYNLSSNLFMAGLQRYVDDLMYILLNLGIVMRVMLEKFWHLMSP